MEKIILITRAELKEIILEVLQEHFPQEKKDLPDTLSLDQAIEVLRDNAYTTSKANIYKLTSTNQIPYSKYGSRLVFSRKSLLEWAKKKTINVTDTTDSLVAAVRGGIR